MIRENQRLFNRLNVISDGIIIYTMLPLAFWLRFSVLPGGVINKPLVSYLRIGVAITLIQVFTYASFGLYRSQRKVRLRKELVQLWLASSLVLVMLFGWLFWDHGEHYSRIVLTLFFAMSVFLLSMKRVLMRRMLRFYRQRGYNQKHVLLVGSGTAARRYLSEIRKDRELGYLAVGYIAKKTASGFDLPYLGGYEALEKVLERTRPDEVISAIEMSDYELTPHIIECCERAGVKLSIIPFYADYMPAHPQFDDLNGIPLMNILRIPLDNFANAFIKRAMDIVGALLMLILGAPLLLVSAVGIKLTSPGPVLFRQTRVGKDRKQFTLLKLRTMEMNPEENSAWSRQEDSRRTKFGAMLRKLSIDELPQALNILSNHMSLVGPRPELPKFVDQFKEDIPLYMVRHQVRPGITGWAQINGYRGDTPIKERVEHDIYYIENWSLWLDIKILLATVFGGKFINDEKLK